jgi:hypothetical protein
VADVCISKKMAMTQADFLRLLPEVFGEDFYQIYPDRVERREPNRKLSIRLNPTGTLKIGAIAMPQLQLDFVFSGYQPLETKAFFKRFNAVYHRGGG